MSKFGEGIHRWFPKDIGSSYGVGVWKGIRKGWEPFKRCISFEVGSGEKVRFWKDAWCGDTKLRRVFPNLFNIEENQDVMDSSYLEFWMAR